MSLEYNLGNFFLSSLAMLYIDACFFSCDSVLFVQNMSNKDDIWLDLRVPCTLINVSLDGL